MRITLVFVLALLSLICSIAFGFFGQQFYDEDISGQEFRPDSEIYIIPYQNDSDCRGQCEEEPELDYDYEGEYEEA